MHKKQARHKRTNPDGREREEKARSQGNTRQIRESKIKATKRNSTHTQVAKARQATSTSEAVGQQDSFTAGGRKNW